MEKTKKKEEILFRKIKLTALQRCVVMPQPLQVLALETLQKTLAKDSCKAIFLMPHRIGLSLKNTKQLQSISVSCGLLSLYGWIAYSIYDRINDGKEMPHRLPLANVFHREMTLLCQKIAGTENADICQKILDILDCAELMESHMKFKDNENTEIPSKRQVTEKSIGLAVPSLLILLHAGIEPNGPEIKKFLEFFRHYTFAKQMSDDLRDWRDDMKNGIVTRVTGKIGKQDAYSAKLIKNVLIQTAKEIIASSKKATLILKSFGIFEVNSFIFSLTDECRQTSEKFIAKNSTQHKL